MDFSIISSFYIQNYCSKGSSFALSIPFHHYPSASLRVCSSSELSFLNFFYTSFLLCAHNLLAIYSISYLTFKVLKLLLACCDYCLLCLTTYLCAFEVCMPVTRYEEARESMFGSPPSPSQHRSACTSVQVPPSFHTAIFLVLSESQQDKLTHLRLMSSSRPTFIDEQLLKRPLPELVPPKLSPTQNPPYSETIRNEIAELKCHPLLESAVSVNQSMLGYI